MIFSAVPPGSMRAAGQAQWLGAVPANPHFAHYRRDRMESLLRVAAAVAAYTDWDLMTARPTWPVLLEHIRQGGYTICRATLHRRLIDLQNAGLLGVVATGRTAGTDPADPEAGNMAAVYVLAVPHQLQLLPGGRSRPAPGPQQHEDHDAGQENQTTIPGRPDPALTSADGPVDENETPSPSLEVTAKNKPPHAREARENQPQAERASSPCPLRDLTREQLIAAGPLISGSEKALWTKNRRFLGAAELRRCDPVLGRASTPDVASMLREWLLTQEWSINDLHYAINHRPDGSLWPHQLTVADIRDVRGFVRYRLNAWRTDPLDPTSPPGRSPSARAEADHIHAQARAQARAQATEADRVHRMPVEDRPPAVVAALAAARARARNNQYTRKHRHT